jgi:hypothetical protein
MFITETSIEEKPILLTNEIMQNLPFQSFRKTSFLRVRPLTEKDYQQRAGVISTKEGRVPFVVGDYLARGISDEEWPIPGHFFATNYQRFSGPDAEGFCTYRALGTRQALQIRTKFTIHYGNNTFLTGNSGDYLVRSGDQIWVTEGSIFERSYQRI